jgi:hypothetical protein
MNFFQLVKSLYDVYDRLEGRIVNSAYLLKQIRRAVPFEEVKIIGNKTLSVTTNRFNVSGAYMPEMDEEGMQPIEVEIAMPKGKSFYYFDEADLSRNHWSELCIDLAGLLGHEFVHLQQFRRRNFNWCRAYKSNHKVITIKEAQEYYGDSDEIDAYAFTAAAELAIETFTPIKTKKPKLENLRLYKTYTKFFNKRDPVVEKFVRLTNRYYKKLEQQYHATTF